MVLNASQMAEAPPDDSPATIACEPNYHREPNGEGASRKNGAASPCEQGRHADTEDAVEAPHNTSPVQVGGGEFDLAECLGADDESHPDNGSFNGAPDLGDDCAPGEEHDQEGDPYTDEEPDADPVRNRQRCYYCIKEQPPREVGESANVLQFIDLIESGDFYTIAGFPDRALVLQQLRDLIHDPGDDLGDCSLSVSDFPRG